ncbi:protein kinase rio1 [Ceratobasidium sp. 395]|nr:protein kinase rio1 [Ceratobasidium sp. 395]
MAVPVHEIRITSPGQFDDADEDIENRPLPELSTLDRAPDFDPRAGQTFIDDADFDALDSDEDEDEDDVFSDDDFGYDEVNHADWEVADGDFTKQYNRLKQHVQVRSGVAEGTPSAIGQNASVAPLPAVNRSVPKRTTANIPTNDKRTADQVALYAKFNSRLANISQPLVHADLSEYNILYHDAHLYIIDVSQSVEHDHPSAFDFLRNDIQNVEAFFGGAVHTLGPRRAFEFITKENINQGQGEEFAALESVLQRWLDEEPEPAKESRPVGDQQAAPAFSQPETQKDRASARSEEQDDAVFLKSYIPRTLNDVYDPERDIARLQRGEGKDLIYGDLTGVVQVNEGTAADKREENTDEGDSETGEGDSDESAQEGEEGVGNGDTFVEKRPRGKRHEDKDAKKPTAHTAQTEPWFSQERKKAAKEEAREKRKHKMPKAEKKRRMKASKS